MNPACPREIGSTRHPFELAQKRALALKRTPINDLHRPQRAGNGARQPDSLIGAAPDHASIS